jgi:hypothetical protein
MRAIYANERRGARFLVSPAKPGPVPFVLPPTEAGHVAQALRDFVVGVEPHETAVAALQLHIVVGLF